MTNGSCGGMGGACESLDVSLMGECCDGTVAIVLSRLLCGCCCDVFSDVTPDCL